MKALPSASPFEVQTSTGALVSHIGTDGQGYFLHVNATSAFLSSVSIGSGAVTLDTNGYNGAFVSANAGLTFGTAGTKDVGFQREGAALWQINGGTLDTKKGGYKVIADNNGGYYTNQSATELLTLNTGGVTTNTSGNLAPANSRIKAILVRVTTTITTAISFTVAVTGGNVFSQIGTATTVNLTLTSGTTYVLVPSLYADQFNTTATTLTVTTNANPGAGALRLTVIYEDYSAPTS